MRYYLAAVEVPWCKDGGVRVIYEEKDDTVKGLNVSYIRVVEILDKENISNSLIDRNTKLICDKKYSTLSELRSNIESLCKPACEVSGDIYGYKVDVKNKVLLTLKIPKKALRTSAYFSSLCKCEFAQIVSIEDSEGNKYKALGQYKVDMELSGTRYNDNRYVKTGGVSFYVDRNLAEKKLRGLEGF